MRVNASGPSQSSLNYGERRRAGNQAEGQRQVQLPAVVAPGEAGEPASQPARPLTGLVAQLLGGMHDAPALRAKRRTGPAAGAETYRTMAAFGPAPAPHFGRDI